MCTTFWSTETVRIPERVAAALTGDDRPAASSATQRVLVQQQAAHGPWMDDAAVEQDADHVAAQQAHQFGPRPTRQARLLWDRIAS